MQFAPGVWWYAIPPFLLVLPAFVVNPWLGGLFAALGAGILGFYRDPERTPPFDGIVSPADGTVSVIRKEGKRIRVGIYMSVRDVHVNRAPVAGTVESVEHEPGAHVPAFSKDSERNEKVHVRYANGSEDGTDYEITLIAGAVARRIRPYVEAGDELERGDRIGHIAFGSRADVVLSPEIDRDNLDVGIGETVTAGETIIARESGSGSGVGIESDLEAGERTHEQGS